MHIYMVHCIYVHMTEHYWAVKKNATTDLYNSNMNKSQNNLSKLKKAKQKNNIFCMSPLIQNFRKQKLTHSNRKHINACLQRWGWREAAQTGTRKPYRVRDMFTILVVVMISQEYTHQITNLYTINIHSFCIPMKLFSKDK